jgi:hypothetical protein
MLVLQPQAAALPADDRCTGRLAIVSREASDFRETVDFARCPDDCDGTALDTEAANGEAIDVAMEEHGAGSTAAGRDIVGLCLVQFHGAGRSRNVGWRRIGASTARGENKRQYRHNCCGFHGCPVPPRCRHNRHPRARSTCRNTLCGRTVIARSEATKQSRAECAPSSRLLRFARNDSRGSVAPVRSIAL